MTAGQGRDLAGRACAWCDLPAATWTANDWPACRDHADEAARLEAAVAESGAAMRALDNEAAVERAREINRIKAEALREAANAINPTDARLRRAVELNGLGRFGDWLRDRAASLVEEGDVRG